MTAVILALNESASLAASVAAKLGAEIGKIEIRRFPDEESYVRIESEVRGRDVIVLASLDRPDEKILQILYLAAAARDLGAVSVGLVAPYLAYMRQDTRFKPGEVVTSKHFAQLVSGWVDWLVTIDPHLHRRSSLGEIYSVPTQVLHAAPLVSEWIKENVANPILIGPDEESTQWVAAVAHDAGAPHVVLGKVRRGDRDVEVTVPEFEKWRGYVPVLVDDIISTARTMIETVGHLRRAGMAPPVCIGVHGIFAGNAYDQLQEAGAATVATTNTIPHISNRIDISEIIASGVRAIEAGKVTSR